MWPQRRGLRHRVYGPTAALPYPAFMKRWLIALLATAVLVSCTATSTPQPSASGSAAPAQPEINERTRGEIQAVLQRQRDAIAGRQLEKYIATIDPGSLALKRCANETFDVAGRQGVGAAGQVGKIDAYLGYVRAHVQEGSNGQRRLFFKKGADGAWLQAEPKESELGGEKKTTVEDIQIDHWGVDQDVIDALGRSAIAAKSVTLKNLLSAERREPLAVRFYPTRSVSGITGCTTAGYHLPNTPNDPYIRMLRYWFTASGEASTTTTEILTHEWLHWAQDQFSTGITARLPWWMVEGWPDYVSGLARGLPCRATWPTLKQLEDGSAADPNAPPELSVQYYAYANTMIEYLYATYGGADAYRRLLLGFKENANPKVTFPKVLDITSDAFYEGWTAFAKKKYC